MRRAAAWLVDLMSGLLLALALALMLLAMWLGRENGGDPGG